MKLYRTGLLAGVIAGAIALTACGSSSKPGSSATGATTGGASAAATNCATGSLKAEGSTAQQNAMNQWIKDYQSKCSGSTITYNGTGSGAGIKNFNGGQVDFAGSDAALDPTKGEVAAAQKRCGAPAFNLPMVTGPIAVAFNVNGVKDLTFKPDVLAKIFLGKIAKWDDPAIKALNSGANLPSTAITVIFRSDSSGTTQNFERYLAASAPDVWTIKPDKVWGGPVGQGKKGSQGVQQGVQSTQGSIAYDEFSFAVSGNLSTAKIDNGGGPVELTSDSASKAVAAATVAADSPGDLTLKLDYATKAAGAYPIILVTYEIVCSKYTDANISKLLKSFLGYTASTGQDGLPDLGYAPLPNEIKTKVQASIASIT